MALLSFSWRELAHSRNDSRNCVQRQPSKENLQKPSCLQMSHFNACLRRLIHIAHSLLLAVIKVDPAGQQSFSYVTPRRS